MANEEQLAILKQGVEVWNEWRKVNPGRRIDLKEANLREVHLRGADLRQVTLTRAFLGSVDLSGADLRVSDLRAANLVRANLIGTQLNGADLSGADLERAKLTAANLTQADLTEAILYRADLGDADLNEARLRNANLRGANLRGTKFNQVFFLGTQFSDVNFSEAGGLDEAIHEGPSTIGTDTLVRSGGNIPDAFLRGCGLSDWEIEQAKLYKPDLSNDEFIDIQNRIFDLRQRQAIQISPLFISYSHADGAFVDKFDGKLKGLGVRFWRDIHDMKAGRIEKQIDIAIRQNPTVLLVLSKSAQKSDWVEHEVRTARELEKEMGRDVLCPVALDDSWKSSPWPRRVMEQIMEYNILDFSDWQNDGKFEGMFRKLIDGLELFYKG